MPVSCKVSNVHKKILCPSPPTPLPKPILACDFEQNDSLNIADLSLKSPGIKSNW